MKKNTRLFLTILIIILCFVMIFFTYKLYIKLSNKKKDNDQIEITKLKFQDELENLGYNYNEIDYLIKKFSDGEIQKYVLKYNNENCINYMKSEYFKIANLGRYIEYGKKNDYSSENVVIYVGINLDKEFYTDIKDVKDPNDELVLVNKYYQLPENYSLEGKVKLESPYSTSGQIVSDKIYESLKNMIDDIKKEKNLSLKVVSGYRSQKTQNYLFNNSKKRNGLEHALIYSAKPRHSEHQTGFAVDLNYTEESFAKTKQYAWLKDNAYKYGFIERYPKGKEFITGYGYEPWHYRYVGVESATQIHDENITFEEYLFKYSN